MSLFSRKSDQPAWGKNLKALLIAVGGLAGVTAASAGISSLRRRQGEAKDDS
jgi:hypothetical protein